MYVDVKSISWLLSQDHQYCLRKIITLTCNYFYLSTASTFSRRFHQTYRKTKRSSNCHSIVISNSRWYHTLICIRILTIICIYINWEYMEHRVTKFTRKYKKAKRATDYLFVVYMCISIDWVLFYVTWWLSIYI